MIVMQLLSSLKHDESERGIYQIGHKLVKSDHTSIIVSSASEDNKLVKRLERDGNIYQQLKMHKKSWWSLLQVRPLRALIKKYNPDIIHVHSRTAAWIIRLALKSISLHNRPKVVATMYGFYNFNLYSRAMFNIDTIITVSDSVTQYLQKTIQKAKLPEPYIVRIYRGVDTRKFPYRYNPSVYWLRCIFSEFPELEHKKWLMFPTIIGEEYGQEWLLDILGNLQKQHPNIHAIILDDDKNSADTTYEEFRQRAFALGIGDKITFIGRKHDDMKEWLSAANLVLGLANEPESIGMPILQAIHLGTPVVGWNKGAYSEILSQLYPQGLVKRFDAKAICKAVDTELKIVSHPLKSNDFILKKTINETINLYANLIGSK